MRSPLVPVSHMPRDSQDDEFGLTLCEIPAGHCVIAQVPPCRKKARVIGHQAVYGQRLPPHVIEDAPQGCLPDGGRQGAQWGVVAHCFSRILSQRCSPIGMAEVAAGDGALQTCRLRGVSANRKSCTRVPSCITAWARMPAG